MPIPFLTSTLAPLFCLVVEDCLKIKTQYDKGAIRRTIRDVKFMNEVKDIQF